MTPDDQLFYALAAGLNLAVGVYSLREGVTFYGAIAFGLALFAALRALS